MGYYMDKDDQIARFMVENSFWISIKTLLLLFKYLINMHGINYYHTFFINHHKVIGP